MQRGKQAAQQHRLAETSSSLLTASFLQLLIHPAHHSENHMEGSLSRLEFWSFRYYSQGEGIKVSEKRGDQKADSVMCNVCELARQVETWINAI